jgi:hypothetical protein
VLTTVGILSALARQCPGVSMFHSHHHSYIRSAAGSNVVMPPALATAWADLLAIHLRDIRGPGADGRHRAPRCRPDSASS